MCHIYLSLYFLSVFLVVDLEADLVAVDFSAVDFFAGFAAASFLTLACFSTLGSSGGYIFLT
jgi:hypothetical protein